MENIETNNLQKNNTSFLEVFGKVLLFGVIWFFLVATSAMSLGGHRPPDFVPNEVLMFVVYSMLYLFPVVVLMSILLLIISFLKSNNNDKQQVLGFLSKYLIIFAVLPLLGMLIYFAFI